MTKALIEGIKEVLRNAYLSAVPVISAALQTLIDGGTVNWKIVGIVFGATFTLAVLRGIDKWIHETDTGFFKDWNGLSIL